MKPKDSIELGVASDLGQCSYEEARQQAVRELIEKGEKSTNFDSFTCLLTVSLWNIDRAIQIMASNRNCDVRAKMSYVGDEWSLLMTTKDTNGVVVWTPGA